MIDGADHEAFQAVTTDELYEALLEAHQMAINQRREFLAYLIEMAVIECVEGPAVRPRKVSPLQ